MGGGRGGEGRGEGEKEEDEEGQLPVLISRISCKGRRGSEVERRVRGVGLLFNGESEGKM